jgi:hypothetical protein
VAHRSPRQRFFPNWTDPRIMGLDPFRGGSDLFCTLLMGPERAPKVFDSRTPILLPGISDSDYIRQEDALVVCRKALHGSWIFSTDLLRDHACPPTKEPLGPGEIDGLFISQI